MALSLRGALCATKQSRPNEGSAARDCFAVARNDDWSEWCNLIEICSLNRPYFQFNFSGIQVLRVKIDGYCRSSQRSFLSEQQLAWAALLGVVVLAIVLRVAPVLLVPSVNWADEIFQATEQAHRLVYGTGLVPWEFQLGARSWLLPGFIAGLMRLAHVVGDGPDYYLPMIASALATLGAAPAVCCFLWCRRAFGVSGAFVAGAIVAVAPELIYFSPPISPRSLPATC